VKIYVVLCGLFLVYYKFNQAVVLITAVNLLCPESPSFLATPSGKTRHPRKRKSHPKTALTVRGLRVILYQVQDAMTEAWQTGFLGSP
jgi:hypothetical protein